jgi:hypothetical protein
VIKKYIITQLTDVSAYIGLFIVLAAIFLPRSFIFIAGIALILTDDAWCRKKMEQWSPKLREILEGKPEGEK